jgi:predicted O-methyltransferase YrrM
MEFGVDIMNQLQLFREHVEQVRKTLQGWCTPEKAKALIDTIFENRPKIVVEIGVFGGASVIPMAMALKAMGDGKVYAIDPWETQESVIGMEDANYEWWKNLNHEDIYIGFVKALIQNELTKECIPIRFTSEQAAPFFKEIDMIHIDGNHSEEKSWLDVELYFDKVRSGGIVVFDDISWRDTSATGTKKAVDFLNENCTVLYDVGDCRFYRKN